MPTELAALAQPAFAGLLGAAVGLVLALTGAGGGVLAVPLLVLVLNWPLSMAAPTGLLAVGLAAALAAAQGLRQGRVRWRAALLMGGMGMLGAPVGVGLAARLPSQPLLLGFAGLMLWLAWRQWPRPASDADAAKEGEDASVACRINPATRRLHWTSPCARALAVTGLLSGTLSGLVGVGGGFVIVPALRKHTDLDLAQVQLTSLAVIGLVACSGVASAAWQGHVPFVSALPFAGGALLAMVLGRAWAHGFSAAAAQRLFALSCLLVAGLLVGRVSF